MSILVARTLVIGYSRQIQLANFDQKKTEWPFALGLMADFAHFHRLGTAGAGNSRFFLG